MFSVDCTLEFPTFGAQGQSAWRYMALRHICSNGKSPPRTDSYDSKLNLECKICARQYGLYFCQLWQRRADSWIERITAPATTALHDIDGVPYMHFSRGSPPSEDTRVYDLAWDLCHDVPLPYTDVLDRKTSINYDLAGRDITNVFQDLRSASKARRRHRNQLDKYYSFRSQHGGVNRGMVGQQYYQFNSFHAVPRVYDDDEIPCMTKQMLYQHAQLNPRPPKSHRRKKRDYTGGKTLKWAARQYDSRRCRREIDADVDDLWWYPFIELHARKTAQYEWEGNWEMNGRSFDEYEVPPFACALEDLVVHGKDAAYCDQVYDVCDMDLLEQDMDWTLVHSCCSLASVEADLEEEEWSLLSSDAGSDGSSLDTASQWSIVNQ